MGVNFGIEYLHTFAIKSPVWLHNKASFVKFESSGTLISNLKKISSFLSFLRVSVVIILICRALGSALADPLEAEDPPSADRTIGRPAYGGKNA